MKRITLTLLLGGFVLNLSAQTAPPTEEPDLVLPGMIILVEDEDATPLAGIWNQSWDVPLPDASYTLQSPAPLDNPDLDNLLDSGAGLLPTVSQALPADWNLLTTLGITLGVPYQVGLELELLRIGKNLPFRLNFSHNTLDSFWGGQGFRLPGDGFSSRATSMRFDISKDPASTWRLDLGLQENTMGLQHQAVDYNSAESRKAWIHGVYRWPLAETWWFSLGGGGDYTQKVLSGTTPASASAGSGIVNPGILWTLGDLGDLTLKGSGEVWALASDVQNALSLGAAGLIFQWNLFPGKGWAFAGSSGALYEDQGFLFPTLGSLSWQIENLRWTLEGGFQHQRIKHLWEDRAYSGLEIPRTPEASPQGKTSFSWNFTPEGSLKLSTGYQGGWLYQNSSWDPSTGQELLALVRGNWWTTEASTSYRLYQFWKNAFTWQGQWGVDTLSARPLQLIQWDSTLGPNDGSWTLSHQLKVSYDGSWELPQGDLSFQIQPSPLISFQAGLSDWTSLFLAHGRIVTGTSYLDPGFRFFVTGRLNL